MERIELGQKIQIIQTEIPKLSLKLPIGEEFFLFLNIFLYKYLSSYHFFHSIALLATPLAKRPLLTGSLMTAGTILFSGTCYYASLTNDQRYNRLAPIGGTLLILGWISLMFF